MSRNDILLTVSEAGRMFSPPVTSTRVRQLVDEGRLPALRTPSGIRLIRADDVRRLVEERRLAKGEQ